MTVIEQKKFYVALGKRIKTARKQAEIKQETLASLLHLSRASIVNIEKGRQHPPIHTLCTMAQTLGVEVASLLPPIRTTENLSPKWAKLVSKELKHEGGKFRVIEFIEQIQSQK
ncbi:MAG TPA: helix-turn-helix transcriptional regulator [Chitinophagales bacterium]|nr:helix-turn-helix transcriptional regulator [Chitinophagales bacterium]